MKTDKFQNKYRIPSARAQWHDYNGGEYFITICTKNREHYFGEIGDGVMILSEIGKCAEECIENVPNHFSDVEIPLFVVMPNHVHLIVIINDNTDNCGDVSIVGTPIVETPYMTSDDMDNDIVETPYMTSLREDTGTGQPMKNEKMQTIADKCGRLSHLISNLKSSVTRCCHQNKQDFGWQTRFHDHIIRNQDEMNRIATYIENNVTNWENDKFFAK